MASISYQIANLLDKMTSSDKDFRFMATNDLMAELQKDSIKLDDDTERKVVKMLLKLLEDKNGEVQNLAVRCLGPLVHKIKPPQLDIIVDSLCSNMESKDERTRDVSSIALKTVLGELPGSLNANSINCVKRVLPRLTEGLVNDEKMGSGVKLEILDILAQIISRFGRVFDMNFEDIEDALFVQFEKDRQALRKRATTALSFLMDVVDNERYDRVVKRILSACDVNTHKVGYLRTYVLITSAICRASSPRFAHFLPQFVPKFIRFCEDNDDDELREACLQAFETFIFRCTKDMNSFLDDIVKATSAFLTHDPNYSYDDIDENSIENGSTMETDSADEEDDDADQDEYSDDDDMSWKVRRAAAKCIEAIVTYRTDRLVENYSTLGTLLISRFKEREDNVKHDIFQAYIALLKQTKMILPDSYTHHAIINDTALTQHFTLEKFRNFVRDELSNEQREVFQVLEKQVAQLVRAIHRQLKQKNLKTREHCFILLTHLLKALPGALTGYFHLLLPGIQSTLTDRVSDSNMKIHTLHFVAMALNTHEPKTLQPHVPILLPLVTNSVQDSFYKVSAEALVVICSIIRVLRPLDGQGGDFDYSPYILSIYESICSKLKITDIDQEVKEKTITAMGLMIATFGDKLANKYTECLPLLLDRLRNEMTRQVTVKALALIVSGPLKVDLSLIISDVLPLLAEFLRKNQRTLRISSLNLLSLLVSRYSQGGLENAGLLRVVKEVPNLINEQDLQVAQLSLKLISDVITAYPDQISDSLSTLLAAVVKLTQSSLLQGKTLGAVLCLLISLVKSPLPNKPTFEQLLDQLSKAVYDQQQLHRQAYISIAKSVATVALAYKDIGKAKSLVNELKITLNNPQISDSVHLFAILTLGELGRIYSAVYDGKDMKPETLITNAFNANSEEIKTAASYALGSLAVGNLEKYLPYLLKEINEQPKRQYLLLHALKEVIASESQEGSSNEVFKTRVDEIWQVLVKHCDSAEEGNRNIAAECLGKLCLIDSSKFLNKLLECVKSNSARMRATAVIAVRFMIVDQPLAVDDHLKQLMSEFLLDTVRDQDLNVRRAAIVTLNSAAHNKPKLIRECLTQLLSSLYSETSVKPELVHEVEMGPFKHTVDEGLDLRKAAFECMYTLIEHCLDRVDIFVYMDNVENGLKDQHDIKLLTFLMLIRLAQLCPTQVAQRVDRFCDLIKPQLLLKPKQNAVKQDNDKQDELKRSAVRTVLTLRRIPHHDRSSKMTELIEIIKGSPELLGMLEAIERDNSSRNIGGSDAPMETE
uniref:TATA-binding protein interacting (TIP20) domain-containing protein n=1 Tax=Acrobeloides nanus TaxID=290746 RepID=A0A914C839_9BILA